MKIPPFINDEFVTWSLNPQDLGWLFTFDTFNDFESALNEMMDTTPVQPVRAPECQVQHEA